MFSVYVDGEILFATGCEPNSPHGLVNPKLSVELGKVGQFRAVVPRSNARYNDIVLLKSQIEIKLRENTVWVGKVEFMDNTWQGMTITCEGVLSYLNDTIFSPQAELVGLHNLFHKAIQEHNDMADDYKQMTAGIITVPDVNMEYDGSYISTLKLLNSLVSDYGGYLVPHYTDSGCYIDWIKDIDTKIEGHEINVTNLETFTQSIDGDGIKTIIRPIGKNSIGVGGGYVRNEVAIALFDKIYGVVDFPDIDDEEELEAEATEYLEDLMWANMNISGKTPEIFEVMNDTSEIPVGKLIRVNVPEFKIGHDFAITAVGIDLNKPTDCTASLSANSIWTQITNGKESQTVIRTTGRIRNASSKTLTSQTASGTTTGTSATGKGFSGTVEFSDNTKLNFRNGILIDGVSTEGAF